MTDATDWQRAADPARRLGRAVEVHESVESTNDRARDALAAGAEGAAVVAELQMRGRGRRGRSWESPAGLNLMVSVALRPRLRPREAGLLGIASAIAVRDACQTMVRQPLRIRWPNDIVADDGLKVAGLLIETALDGDAVAEAVIGAGINVNWPRQEMPVAIRGRATSLVELAGRPLDRVVLLSRLLDRLDGEIALLEHGESPVDRFRTVSALAGREVAVDTGTELLHGVVSGIGEDGSLLLETGGTQRALSVGEVVAVRDGPAAGVLA